MNTPEGEIRFGDVRITVQYVTPELAAQWLERNRENRNPKQFAIDQFVRMMKADQWPFTGEPIQFVSGTGILANGQNRLRAIIKSGTAQWILIVDGISDPARDVIDTGTRRSFADDFKMRGIPNSASGSALAHMLLKYPDCKPHDRVKFSNAEVLNRYYETPEKIQRLSRALVRVGKEPGLTGGSTLGVVLYHAESLSNVDEVAAFVSELCDPSQAASRSSGTALLNRWHKNRKQVGLNAALAREMVAVSMKAWNLWVSGDTSRSILTYRSGGSQPENWPVLRGWQA